MVAKGRERVLEREAMVWGDMDAMKIFLGGGVPGSVLPVPLDGELGRLERSKLGEESRALSTSVWDCRDTRTASAEVTQPEQARQSVRLIWAGAVVVLAAVVGFEGSLIWTSFEEDGIGSAEDVGSVSTGFMQATLGDMKSFRVSVESIADIVVVVV